MAIIIAGSPVALGDLLYSRRANTQGTVVAVGESTATLEVLVGAETRRYVVSNGGLVSGIRDIYWHAPLALDLGKGSTGKLLGIQTVVDALVTIL